MARKAAKKTVKKTAKRADKPPAQKRKALSRAAASARTPAAKARGAARKPTPGTRRAEAAIKAPIADSRVERAESPAQRFAVEIARTCKDDHCEQVVVLDVRGKSSVTDFITIASGTSDRQMRSVLRHCEELGHASGFPAVRTSSDERATWLVADFVDVTLHLFEPSTRSHYDLEMLWGDAPRVEWERKDQAPRDRAGLAAARV